MCGIAGCIGTAPSSKVIDSMVEAMRHRGPDDFSVWQGANNKYTLVHRRLAILDRSPAGRQPMSYGNGRLWIALNGEIYNFKELREELVSLGHSFKTATDTEVVLASYIEWGPVCIKRLRGMFALVLVDLAPPVGWPDYIIARDRFGIKPLLIHEVGRSLSFASELRTLLCTQETGWHVDRKSLYEYFATGTIYQPNTIIAGIKSLPAGHWLEGKEDLRRIVRYWDLHDSTKDLRSELKGISEKDAVAQLDVILKEATRIHMLSDVPLGAFLSGGIDSTAIVGLMTEASGTPVKTFSVGFEDKHSAIDERSYARRAAEHLKSDHQEVIISGKDVADTFINYIAAIDQPSIDGLNTWVVSKAAKKHVTVSLSGIGGDELFAGYPHFGMLAGLPPAGSASTSAALLLESARGLLGRQRHLDHWLLNLQLRQEDTAGRLALLRRILSNSSLRTVILPSLMNALPCTLRDMYEPWVRADADSIQQTTYAEINGYLQSTLLRDSDALAMNHSLEIRPILLDHKLAEFAYALPDRLKWNSGSGKRVFIKAVSRFVPAEILNRPKMGFSLPYREWMAGELQPQFKSLLHTTEAKAIFTPDYLKSLETRLSVGTPPYELWAWGTLLAWLKQANVTL